MKRLINLIMLVMLVSCGDTIAHEIRPAYLQIQETQPTVYNIMWKVPSNGNRVIDIQPKFDEKFTLSSLGHYTALEGFVVYRYTLNGEHSLSGTGVSITNLGSTTIDTLVTVKLMDGSSHTLLIQPKHNFVRIPATHSSWKVAVTYAVLGIEHILLGIDHLLFVLALLLIVRGFKTLIKTITAFTVAHSITLAGVALGYFSLPPTPVEVLIALSIMLVCVEAVRQRRGVSSIATQWPWLIAFAFGLLHGFGFAGAILDIGLPQTDAPIALLFFNVGVELGQIAFVVTLLCIGNLVKKVRLLPKHVAISASYLIGSLSSFWVFERLFITFQ
ncbi:HupE/UreJ family protein [Thalassotalea ponticola]|uniref:HupE/UreJ family protein n=1 Tax=Thalassotalea ponticola TaxID=1523392 RepID=UPI0025B4EEAC|nr:HupE/UreJ family protein [Thalassotalea ponticola]MDN3651424.1 HupE/UreJ family protein [Thalassotalea ponticola]